MPAYPGCPGKELLNRCLSVLVHLSLQLGSMLSKLDYISVRIQRLYRLVQDVSGANRSIWTDSVRHLVSVKIRFKVASPVNGCQLSGKTLLSAKRNAKSYPLAHSLDISGGSCDSFGCHTKGINYT